MKYLILVLLVVSCGTRKRTVDTSIQKMDVVTHENFEVAKVSEETSHVREDDVKLTLEPINLALPIIYKTDTIYNSRVIYQRILRDSIVVLRDTVFLKQSIYLEDKSKIKEKQTEAETERPNPWLWLGLTLVVVLGLYLYIWFE